LGEPLVKVSLIKTDLAALKTQHSGGILDFW